MAVPVPVVGTMVGAGVAVGRGVGVAREDGTGVTDDVTVTGGMPPEPVAGPDESMPNPAE